MSKENEDLNEIEKNEAEVDNANISESNKIENDEPEIKNENTLEPDNIESDSNNESEIDDNEYADKLNKKVMRDYEVDFDKLENMSDDEAVLELDKMTGKNDELIEKDYLSSLVNQKDRMVYYEVENIYHNPDKKIFQNRFKMRRNPPTLTMRDDLGNEAKFYLTENLTDELSETLRQVKRAYYGFHKPSDMYVPEKIHEKIRYYVKNNPFKILATIFLILFLLTLLTK